MKDQFRYFFPAALALILAGCCCGCTTTEPGAVPPAPEVEVTDASIEFGNRLLEAIMTDDFSKFKACVGADSDIKTEEDFAQSQATVFKQFGKMTAFEYVTSLETPLVQNMVWKVTFSRKGNQNREIEQQLLFRLLLGKVDGKFRVLGMGFI